MNEGPIERKWVFPPEVYIVCTIPGHLDVQIVHSHGLAAAIVELSQQPGKLSRHIADRDEFEHVKAQIEAEDAVMKTVKERQIEPVTFVDRSAGKDGRK